VDHVVKITKLLVIVAAVVVLISAGLSKFDELSFQSLIAVNNKGHQGMSPYKIALTQKLGVEFTKAHFLAEGRAECVFSNQMKEDCAFITLQNIRLDDGLILKTLTALALNPCPSIDESSLRSAMPNLFKNVSEQTIRSTISFYIRPERECRELFSGRTARVTFLENDVIKIEAVHQK